MEQVHNHVMSNRDSRPETKKKNNKKKQTEKLRNQDVLLSATIVCHDELSQEMILCSATRHDGMMTSAASSDASYPKP